MDLLDLIVAVLTSLRFVVPCVAPCVVRACTCLLGFSIHTCSTFCSFCTGILSTVLYLELMYSFQYV